METLYIWLLSFGVLFTQHFLSRRNNPFWGVILPVAYIGLLIWMLFIKKAEFEVVFVIVFLVLLGIWSEGRIYIKKKRKKELEKIAVQDL